MDLVGSNTALLLSWVSKLCRNKSHTRKDLHSMYQSHFTFRASRSGDGGDINMPKRELALGSGIRENQDKALTLSSINTGNKASIASQCFCSGEVSLSFPAQRAPSLLFSISETLSLSFIFLFIWKVKFLLSLSPTYRKIQTVTVNDRSGGVLKLLLSPCVYLPYYGDTGTTHAITLLKPHSTNRRHEQQFRFQKCHKVPG